MSPPSSPETVGNVKGAKMKRKHRKRKRTSEEKASSKVTSILSVSEWLTSVAQSIPQAQREELERKRGRLRKSG